MNIKVFFLFALCTFLFSQICAAENFPPHPLDDLNKNEIELVVSIIKNSKKFPPDILFSSVATLEPPKKDILAASTLPRQATTILYDRRKNQTWEAVVNLSTAQLQSFQILPGVQPPIMMEEYEFVPEIVKKDPAWQQAMKKRNITDLDEVFLDIWAPGPMSEKENKSQKRLVRAIPFYKGKSNHLYGRPIEGLIATVDVNAKKVIDIWDTGVVRMVKTPKELDEKSNGPLRTDLKPLKIVQEKGPSFTLRGQQIQWQNWNFRYSLHPIRGLVLYQVSYQDKKKENTLRPILYKASLSEMVVPYGEPGKTWTFRSAFDVGEYGLGATAHPLRPVKDVPENAVFVDAQMVQNSGEVLTVPNALAWYEKDGGTLWKHYDSTTTLSEGRRARQLALTFMTTIGNYDYGINWIFHQDGTLEMVVELTGIVLSKGTPIAQNSCQNACQFLVEPHISAPLHQHFFNFRLDLDVDGNQTNSPIEINTKPLPLGKLNPQGNVFVMEQTYLKSEKKAARDLSLASSRKWKVINSEIKNTLGHPTGYGLIPGENAVPYLQKNSPIRKKASFLNHHVWFSAYKDHEQSGAGDFPNQSQTHQGLDLWIKDNELLEKKDVVLWYTFGVTHITRPEDWPVMPVHRAGFKLVPINFFNENPAMDVPDSK